MRGVFQAHARWVAWATEHHIQHHAFATAGDTDGMTEAEEARLEAIEEESRRDMPLHLLKHHVIPDTKAMLGFAPRADERDRCATRPSFLTRVKGRAGERWARLKARLKARAARDIAKDRKVERALVKRRTSVDERQRAADARHKGSRGTFTTLGAESGHRSQRLCSWSF